MWVIFLCIVAFSLIIIALLWQFCGAAVRKYPVRLLALGFFISILGVLLTWVSGHFGDFITGFMCKRHLLSESECSLDKILSELTEQFIEVGFAALGAGLMGLAFDIKTKDDLDLKMKIMLGSLDRIKEREMQWKEKFDQLEKDLDTLQPAEKIERFSSLRNENMAIFDDKLDVEEAAEKWL